MKLLNDNKGYITGILIMVLIIHIMFLLITIFVAIKNYVDLEKKVKELNKEESFTNAQKYVII